MEEFWDRWANITDREKLFIEAAKQIYNELFNYIPKEAVISVYVGGSFARREINEKSDIDTLIIVKQEFLNELIPLGMNSFKLVHDITTRPHIYSFEELEHQTYLGKIMEGRYGTPAEIINHLNEYQLVYGQDLSRDYFKNIKHDILFLRQNINRIKNIVQRRMTPENLQAIAKTMFFVFHFEKRIREQEKFVFHRKSLLKKFEDTHLIRRCEAIRNNPEKYFSEYDAFINEITSYIKNLEKEEFS